MIKNDKSKFHIKHFLAKLQSLSEIQKIILASVATLVIIVIIFTTIFYLNNLIKSR